MIVKVCNLFHSLYYRFGKNTWLNMDVFFENQGLSHIGEKILNNLDLKSQIACWSVRKSWRSIIEKKLQKVYNAFIEKFGKDMDDQNRKMWLKFAKMICNETSYKAKSYLLNFVLKHEEKHFETPLTTFLKVGNFKMVKFILKNSLFKWSDWSLELKKAAEIGQSEVVKCLVRYIPIPMFEEIFLSVEVAIFLAAENGQLEVMKVLLQKVDPSFAYKNFGWGNLGLYTILHVASKEGHIEIMQYFVNKFDKDKMKLDVKHEGVGARYFAITPIELAVIDNQLGVVKILCNALVFSKHEKACLLSEALVSKEVAIIEYLFNKFKMKHILKSFESTNENY